MTKYKIYDVLKIWNSDLFRISIFEFRIFASLTAQDEI